MIVVAYVPDLMDRSKVTAAVPDVVLVRRLEDLMGQAAGATVVVDLSRPGVIDQLAALTAVAERVIGFGSHVDTARLDAARATGAVVLARSAFFARIAEVIAR